MLTTSETETLLEISKVADRAHASAFNTLMGYPINISSPPELLTLGQEDTTTPASTPKEIWPLEELWVKQNSCKS